MEIEVWGWDQNFKLRREKDKELRGKFKECKFKDWELKFKELRARIVEDWGLNLKTWRREI